MPVVPYLLDGIQEFPSAASNCSSYLLVDDHDGVGVLGRAETKWGFRANRVNSFRPYDHAFSRTFFDAACGRWVYAFESKLTSVVCRRNHRFHIICCTFGLPPDGFLFDATNTGA